MVPITKGITLDILFELLDKSLSSQPLDNPINENVSTPVYTPVSPVVSNLLYNPDAKITIIDYGLARKLPDAHWKELEESMNRFDNCKGNDAIECKMYYYKYALNILYGQYSAHDNALWDKELRHLYGWIRGRSYISGTKDFEIESENITNKDLNAFIEVKKVKEAEKKVLTELAKSIGIPLPFNPEQNTFYKKGGNAKPDASEIKKQLGSVVETIRAWKKSIDNFEKMVSEKSKPNTIFKMIPDVITHKPTISAYGGRKTRRQKPRRHKTRKQKTRRHKS